MDDLVPLLVSTLSSILLLGASTTILVLTIVGAVRSAKRRTKLDIANDNFSLYIWCMSAIMIGFGLKAGAASLRQDQVIAVIDVITIVLLFRRSRKEWRRIVALHQDQEFNSLRVTRIEDEG